MKVKLEQLASRLKKSLDPLYLVFGDEPLLVNEACGLIKATAQQAGYLDKQTFHADRAFSWPKFMQSAASYSLFSEKTLLDLRLPIEKPLDTAAKALLEYAQRPAADKILVVQCGKLDAAVQQAKWFKQFDQAGIIVQVWPVSSQQLPHWIKQTAQKLQLSLSPGAIQLIADRVEGHLLAAQQELDKLVLLYGAGHIDESQVMQAVSQTSRYNCFQLADETLEGNKLRALRMLDGLCVEGTEPILILWTILRDLRTLSHIKSLQKQGIALTAAFHSVAVWPKRQKLYQTALKRWQAPEIYQFIADAAKIDRMIKGMHTGHVWRELQAWICMMAEPKLDRILNRGFAGLPQW